MWAALAARWQNDQTRAHELYARAWALQSRLRSPHNAIQFAAQIFHTDAGEWRDALRVTEDEIAVNARHELRFLEAKRRLRQIELLQTLGRDTTIAAAQLRATAASLKSRAHWEARLQELEAGK